MDSEQETLSMKQALASTNLTKEEQERCLKNGQFLVNVGKETEEWLKENPELTDDMII